jgi:integrase
VDRVAAAMPGNYQLLVRILGILGLRFGEAAALRRRSVDLLRRRLTVERSATEVAGRLTDGPTKTHAVRAVPLPRSLANELEHYLSEHVSADPDAWVFRGPGDGRLRRSTFYNRIWLPTLTDLGLPRIRLHTLRHSAAARLIAAGASPKAVQAVLGHATAGFSLTVYGHLFDTDLDALAHSLDSQIRGLPRPDRGLDPRADTDEEASQPVSPAVSFVRPEGFEPPTRRLEVCRSIP